MPEPYPSFSVVVPTYSRPGPLAACLKALAGLDYPSDRFEVVVVDDGGDTSTAEVVEAVNVGAKMRLIRKPNGGPASARNAGAAATEGEFLAFTDDDCQPTRDWLKRFSDALREGPEDLWGGKTVNLLLDNIYSTVSQQLLEFLHEHYTEDNGEPRFVPSSNLAVRRSRFLEVGGFDVSFPLPGGEDWEFCDRWRQAGGRIRYEPAARVGHAHHMGCSAFCRQHFTYGRGAFHFRLVRARRTPDKIQIEPLAFYRKMLAYPFANASSGGHPLRVSALIACSQIANAAGFFWALAAARRVV